MTWLFIAIVGVLLGLTVRVAAVLFCAIVVIAGAAIVFLLDAIELSGLIDIVVALIALQLFYLLGLLIAVAFRSARDRAK